MAATKLRPLERVVKRAAGLLGRILRSQTMLAVLGTLVAIALFSLGGLALDWWVYNDRYQIGFIDYLRVFVF